jgi:hypothetical protein
VSELKDYKLKKLGEFVRDYRKDIAPALTSFAIKEVQAATDSFGRNMERVLSSYSFPRGLMSSLRGHSERSKRSGTGGRATIPAFSGQNVKPRGEDPIQEALKDLQETGKDIEEIQNGLEAMMSAMIVGTWTAFETMAGDLWATALDIHPEGLAELKGSKEGNRLNTTPDTHEKRTAKTSVSLKYIRALKFSTSGNMGALLRNVVDFNSVRSILESYRMAFWQDDRQIETALDYRKLRKLSLVRNLLVHKAGKIDGRFLEESADYPDLKSHNLGDSLPLDGLVVRGLIEPAVKCSRDLIDAVYQWLTSH